MAFNKHRGKEIEKCWQNSYKTNLLITHKPPFGNLDNSLGYEELLSVVTKIISTYHFFGNINCQNRTAKNGEIHFINTEFVDELIKIETAEYSIIAKPIFFTL